VSREEYVQEQRMRVVEVASSMIDGSLDYLTGAHELVSLRTRADIPEDDVDFLSFSGVRSETDHLPIGPHRSNWSKEALARHDPEIQEATRWARDVSLSHCKSILERFEK